MGFSWLGRLRVGKSLGKREGMKFFGFVNSSAGVYVLSLWMVTSRFFFFSIFLFGSFCCSYMLPFLLLL